MRISTTANTCKIAMLFLAAVLFIQVILSLPFLPGTSGKDWLKTSAPPATNSRASMNPNST